MNKWKNHTFESSSGLTPEFAAFARDYKKEIRKICGDKYDVVNFNRGHFYVSGFVKNLSTGKFAYFCTNDVRYSPGAWMVDILVRTALSETDYTGGSNHSYALSQLSEAFDELTQ